MASTPTASFFILLSLAFFLSQLNPTTASSQISAVFAFGDSTIDSGNNNHLSGTLFRSDHLPYGRDLPLHHPTGRFSNGKLATDYLVHALGLKDLLPAYLDPTVTDYDLLTGVSFGSGGAGLDNMTNSLNKVLDLETQFRFFEEALQRIKKQVGDQKATEIIENALFMVSIGTNDMLYNVYLLPSRGSQYTVPRYQDLLLQELESFIQRLYNAGARRMLVAGLPPVGCLPIEVTVSSMIPSPGNPRFKRSCNYKPNEDSQAYNDKLQSRIQSLLARLNGAKVAYFDIYTPIFDMIQNPANYGFQETLQGCCGTGLVEIGPLCNLYEPSCYDPSKYLFWDAVHPTQAGYSVIADNLQKTALPYLNS